MVDFVKLLIKDYDPLKLEGNRYLDFYDNINLETGEIKTINKKGKRVTPHKQAYYKDLDFRIYETGTITIAGSLHKYYNAGGHNYNDFDFNAFLGVLKDLQKKFNLDLNKCILRQLEVGINVVPPKPTNEILEYSFLHKTTPFEFKYNSDEGKYLQAKHSQYIIKFYNKYLHYKKAFLVETEIMRFEIKYTKMKKVNAKGIFTLQDLADKGLYLFKEDLLQEWNNVLFYDCTINHKSKVLDNYNNPIYWNRQLQKKSHSAYYKHRRKLSELTANHSENLQEQIRNIMSEKVDFLNGRGTRFDSLYIGSIPVPPLQEITAKINNVCQVTSLNISMQRDDSFLLSHTGLNYYYKTDKKIFEEVKRKYLSKTW
ncbi:hypothetical protein [Gillisia limnaea]|uniref:Uncharacterized protein n=1 Tax=Gillisia limnaea (strain DSM 15749 / LMG 21470 / R-8282) TaxID=865937 RepID=H2BVC0_GILLR|nr:hypothetical protein [Gillisia limnaea]EHQ01785.1 hypothetical protein Gilli_1111 [Gillisia limnaea DSM 15749]